MTPQEFYEKHTELKAKANDLHLGLVLLEEEFLTQHPIGLEYPVLVEGKQKFIRVYAPEGRFVYNVKYEVGLRATAKNLG